MRIAVTGATGFVGRSFIQRFNGDYRIRGLGRSSRPPGWLPRKAEWQPTDLYSLLDAEKALKGCDLALYLVHSMLPSARLNQGSFEDTDLILADNFARAAKKAGVKKIIYLGGILPDKPEADLSLHLRSRKEVETVLGSTGWEVADIHKDIGSKVVWAQMFSRNPVASSADVARAGMCTPNFASCFGTLCCANP